MKILGIVVAVIAALASVASAAVAVWIGFTSSSFSRPSLEVGFGISRVIHGGDLRSAGLTQDGPINYLVYVTDLSDNSPTLFTVPFYLWNRSSRALHDITFRLTYPKRMRFSNYPIHREGVTTNVNPDYDKFRSVSENGDFVTSEYTIPLLRPGEQLGFGEPLLLNNEVTSEDRSTRSRNVTSLTFRERLKERVDLIDLARIGAFAAAAEDGPYTPNLNIVWVRGEANDTTNQAIADRIAAAAWGPYRPEPGIYFKWPWKPNFAQMEFMEVVDTSILQGTDAQGAAISIQDFDHEQFAPASYAFPTWDYWGPIR